MSPYPQLAIGVETMSRYFITPANGGFNVIEKVGNKYIIYPTLPKLFKTSKPVKFF